VLKRTATNLLFIVYHAKAPVLARLSRRALEKLFSLGVQIDGLETPLQARYLQSDCQNADAIKKKILARFQKISLMPLPASMILHKELPFAVPAAGSIKLNNSNLLMEKLGALILNDSEDPGSLRAALDKEQRVFSRRTHCRPVSEVSKEKYPSTVPSRERTYVVIAHLSEEEDISFLVKVLYYWEMLYPQFSHKYPQTVEQYKVYKEQKEKKEILQAQSNDINASQLDTKAKGSASECASGTGRIADKIFQFLPDFNAVSDCEERLPLGWQFNYSSIYNDMKVNKVERKTIIKR